MSEPRRSSARHKRFVPEVLQSSAMDCGPASLKALMEGFGLEASYSKLREACQTSVDGTSIDVIEEVANALGLEAEQIVIPIDHLLEPTARALPAMVVTTLPTGATHFVVVWSVVGGFVQVMDPGQGRRWVKRDAFLSQLYEHGMAVGAADWLEWAQTEEFLAPLSARLRSLVKQRAKAKALLVRALDSAQAEPLARLDAATRFVALLGLRGEQAERWIAKLSFEGEVAQALEVIPGSCWSAAPLLPDEDAEDDAPQLWLRGGVALRVLRAAPADTLEATPARLQEILASKSYSPAGLLWQLLKANGPLRLACLSLLVIALAAVGIVEALSLQAMLSLGGELASGAQRLGALVAGVSVLLASLLGSLLYGELVQGAGRVVEVVARRRLFVALAAQSPEFFASRLKSDVIERAHALGLLKNFSSLVFGGLGALVSLLSLSLALAWMEPALTLTLLICVTCLTLLPLLTQPFLAERELRARTYAASLGQHMLDALMGVMPLRAHGAQHILRAEHERGVVSWSRAQHTLLKADVVVELLQLMAVGGATVALIYQYWRLHPSMVGALLIVYWCGRLGAAGQQLGQALGQYPSARNVALRLAEILEVPTPAPLPAVDATHQGAAVRFEHVRVIASGHTLLDDLDLEISPGEHVAVVGPSGAGKSTLLRCLLGQHTELEGQVLIDGRPADYRRAHQEIVWVDPSAQLWRGSMLSNVLYGADEADASALSLSLAQTELDEVMSRSVSGSQREVGEGGAALSGGEGQRVRLARGWLKGDKGRLVLLDEAWRGLERERRERMMATARQRWQGSTMLCVTHDVALTTGFDRVLVIEHGQLVEQGVPAALLAQPASRYKQLVEAEQTVFAQRWGDARWSKYTMDAGKLRLAQRAQPVLSADAAPEVMPNDEPSPLEPPADPWCWPAAELGASLAWLGRASAGALGEGGESSLSGEVLSDERALARWFEVNGPSFGVEGQAVSCPLQQLTELLRYGAPMWVMCRDAQGQLQGAYVVLRAGWRGCLLQGPRGQRRWISISALSRAISGDAIMQHTEGLSARLSGLGFDEAQAKAAAQLLVERRLGQRYEIEAWRLTPAQPAGALSAVVLKRVWPLLAKLVGVSALGQLFGALSWWALWDVLARGSGAERGLLAWAALVLSAAPVGALSLWFSGLVMLRASATLRLEMMRGALSLPLSKLRGLGQATMMGRLNEAEVATAGALIGGQGTILGAVSLCSAALIFAVSGYGSSLLPLMLVWCITYALLGVALWRRLSAWTLARLSLTERLVEQMVGHTTRQLQDEPARFHQRDDQELARYVALSTRWDRLALVWSAWGGQGFVLAALLVMAPAWLAQDAGRSAGELAAALGGILLATQGFGQGAASVIALMRARLAWSLSSDWFASSAQGATERSGEPKLSGAAIAGAPGAALLSTRGLSLMSADRVEPVLSGLSLEVMRGEHVLLEGASGSGKSSLVSILAGQRAPDQGAVSLCGIDLPALGHKRWRHEVVLVSQFHENHLFTGTLAMNLLLGHRWPASEEELGRAYEVCEALGLGPLLEKMPGGLNQLVGETGWSLSHGERHRVFVARALLQGAKVVIFDESFGALDPELLDELLERLTQRIETMIVIAHP